MTGPYQVQRWSPNVWHSDGSPVIERDCGHRHRTMREADKCRRALVDYNPRTRMWSAAWHRAVIIDLTTGRLKELL